MDEGKDLLLRLDYESQPYDGALIQLLQTGRLDESAFGHGVDLAAAASAQDSVEQERLAILASYHDNFRAGAKEICGRLEALLSRHHADLSPSNRVLAVSMLLSLRPSRANQRKAKRWLESTIAAIPPAERGTVFNVHRALAKVPGLSDVKYVAQGSSPSVAEIMTAVAVDPGGSDPEKFRELLAYGPRDIAKFLREYSGRTLIGVLRRYYERLKHAEEPHRFELQKLMNDALEILAKEDLLNRLRIARIGDALRKQQPPPKATG